MPRSLGCELDDSPKVEAMRKKKCTEKPLQKGVIQIPYAFASRAYRPFDTKTLTSACMRAEGRTMLSGTSRIFLSNADSQN